jgi:hypothetical protein
MHDFKGFWGQVVGIASAQCAKRCEIPGPKAGDFKEVLLL